MICKQCGRDISNNKGDYSCDGCGSGIPKKIDPQVGVSSYFNNAGGTYHIHSYDTIYTSGGGGGCGMIYTIGHGGAGGASNHYVLLQDQTVRMEW